MRPAAFLLFLTVACSRHTEFIGSAPIWNCGARCFADENLQGLPRPLQALWAAPADPIAANKPELRYPLAGSLHPIDLDEITFQWRSAGAMQSYYRVRLSQPARSYELYIPCRAPPTDPVAPASDECQYAMPARAWAALAAESAGAELTATIAAADPARRAVAESDPISLSFSLAALDVGITWFSAGRAAGRNGILRAPLGAAAQPFLLPTTRFGCVGCHAISRDGRTEAYVYERQYLGVTRAEDPAAPLVTPAEPPVPDAATVAVSPDGSLLAVSQDGQLSVRDAASGRELDRADPSVPGLYFPDWSPDGRSLVATQAATAENSYTVTDGSIVVLAWEGARFGAVRTLVAGDATQLHFHPAWSPDGAWIAFASAPLPGRSYDNPQARLRLVPSAGGAPIDLGHASAGAGASWPRFAPVTHAGGNVLYLSFDGKGDYGFLLRGGGRLQLWLAAVDLRKLPADPSSAPVWLPAQDLHVANVLSSWAERLVCGPRSPCGERARCDAGRCVRVPP